MGKRIDGSTVQVFTQLAPEDHLRLKSLAIATSRSLHRTIHDILAEAVKHVEIPEGWKTPPEERPR